MLLPDGWSKYLSKYLDDKWMREYGFLPSEPDLGKLQDMVASFKKVITTGKDSKVIDVIGTMKEHGISQIPVLKGNEIEGIVTESSLISYLLSESRNVNAKLSELPQLIDDNYEIAHLDTPVQHLSDYFGAGKVVLVLNNEKDIIAIVSKIDFIEHMSKILTI